MGPARNLNRNAKRLQPLLCLRAHVNLFPASLMHASWVKLVQKKYV